MDWPFLKAASWGARRESTTSGGKSGSATPSLNPGVKPHRNIDSEGRQKFPPRLPFGGFPREEPAFHSPKMVLPVGKPAFRASQNSPSPGSCHRLCQSIPDTCFPAPFNRLPATCACLAT